MNVLLDFSHDPANNDISRWILKGLTPCVKNLFDNGGQMTYLIDAAAMMQVYVNENVSA
jgi:hypothetical protein